MATLAEVLRQAGYVTPQGQVVGPRTDLAQKLKSYVMNIPQNAAQNLANQRADIDAALTMGQGGIEVGDRAAFERQMAQVPNLMGLTAYHGTPHTIKGKFDISKVGTGEGAQSYGHGMYFAENPAVAESYKIAGAAKYGDPDAYANMIVKTYSNNPDKALKVLNNIMPPQGQTTFSGESRELVENAIKSIQSGTYKGKEVGNLYKVDIPDEYIPNMLDWDKPLSQQPKAVQDVAWKYKDALIKQTKMTGDKSIWDLDGASLYGVMQRYMPAEKGKVVKQNVDFADVSKNLNELGVKGIRYADEGSRNAQQRWIARHPKGGESDFPTLEQAQAFINRYPNDKYTLIEPKPLTSNFVVFEPSDVKILEQNSKPMTRKEIIEQELEKVAK